MILPIFIISFSSFVFSNECNYKTSQSGNISDLEMIAHYKKCQSGNDQMSKRVQNNLVQFETTRLSTQCAQKWDVVSDGKILQIPAGLKVLKLNDHEIIFHFQGEVRKGKINKQAFIGNRPCKEMTEKPNFSAFKEEALFQLELAKKLNPKANRYFDSQVDLMLKKLNSTEFNEKKFEEINKKWNQTIDRRNKTKPELVSDYSKLIFSHYDPKNMENKTMIVPISTDWFNSNPKLKSFFEKTWLSSGYDLRITGGYSGEGLTYYSNAKPEMNETYFQMEGLLRKTHAFLTQSKDKELMNSEEAKWLNDFVKKDLTQFDRMIFFSPATWNEDPTKRPWADYIPVDQSLGGLKSDYLLSVMIHEINVNSPNFLCADTHAPEEDSDLIRQCVVENGINELSLDPASLQRLFGYNPQLSLVYLKMILE
jgi:hypothetical protein